MVRLSALITLILALIIGTMMLIARRDTAQVLAWFTQEHCDLPCWRGITPGITYYLDALRILRNQPDIQIESDDTPSGYPYVAVTFRMNTKWGDLRGEMVSDENASRVQHIYISPVTEKGIAPFRLATLITVYGSPAYMMPDSGVGGIIRIIYPTRHFEALSLQWSLFSSVEPCNRFNASVGLYIGDDPNFQPWEVWRGYTRKFDEWCRQSR